MRMSMCRRPAHDLRAGMHMRVQRSKRGRQGDAVCMSHAQMQATIPVQGRCTATEEAGRLSASPCSVDESSSMGVTGEVG